MEIRGVSSIPAARPSASTDAAAMFAGTAVASQTESVGGGGYISPVLRYDQGARLAVLYFRDYDTGETRDQIPAERVVAEYRRTAGRLGGGTGETRFSGSDREGTGHSGTTGKVGGTGGSASTASSFAPPSSGFAAGAPILPGGGGLGRSSTGRLLSITV